MGNSNPQPMESNSLPLIGVFPLTNTGGICVHAIEGDRVQVSLNRENPEWLDVIENPLSVISGEKSDDDKWESGFMWGSFFIPFSEIMRA